VIQEAKLGRTSSLKRVVGSLAYFATDIVEPGAIRHTEGNRISFGEPDGTRSDRTRAIAEALIAAGFRCPITSMLQDFEAGRPMELEAIVGAVVELADRLGVPVPCTRTVYAAAKLMDETRGALRPREVVL
jgi:ketopantoate reductase